MENIYKLTEANLAYLVNETPKQWKHTFGVFTDMKCTKTCKTNKEKFTFIALSRPILKVFLLWNSFYNFKGTIALFIVYLSLFIGQHLSIFSLYSYSSSSINLLEIRYTKITIQAVTLASSNKQLIFYPLMLWHQKATFSTMEWTQNWLYYDCIMAFNRITSKFSMWPQGPPISKIRMFSKISPQRPGGRVLWNHRPSRF